LRRDQAPAILAVRAAGWRHNQAVWLRRLLERRKSDPLGGLALAFFAEARGLIEEGGRPSHPQQIPSKHFPASATFLSPVTAARAALILSIE
jgi:hypothetical protein